MMRRSHLPARSDLHGGRAFEELYEDISRDWQYRARAFQIRRWRTIRQREKHGER